MIFIFFIEFILSKRIKNILKILFSKINFLPSFSEDILATIPEQKLKLLWYIYSKNLSNNLKKTTPWKFLFSLFKSKIPFFFFFY